MKAYSVPALIIATICLTIALSDSLAWVRRNKKTSDIAFILICLGGTAFCLFCAGEYSVDFPVQSIFWLKGEVIASTISGFALLWFIAEETQLIDRRIVIGGLVWAALSVLSQVFDLGDLTWVASQPLVLHVDLPFGLDFLYQEVARGIVLIVITSGGFIIELYLVWVVSRFWGSGNRKESVILFLALGFVILAQIIDFFIGIGLLSFIFLLEYAWVATILVVGLKRSNDSIEAAVTRKVLEKTDLALKVSQTTLSTIIDSTDDLIWSVDTDSFTLLTFNKAFQDYFSQKPDQPVAAGMSFADLIDSEAEQARWLEIYRQGLNNGTWSIEYESSQRDRIFLVGVNTLRRDDRVFGLSVFAHDITERKQAEEQVRRALSEKEVLLLEVYHRTKNNMNVIISMLKLQSNQMADQRLKEAFAVSIDRIMTMSLVHSHLYKSVNLSRIDLKDYLQELVDRLADCHALPDCRPSIVFDLDSVHVMIDIAINCGMLVNELVTNALKFAFTGGRQGEILVRLRRHQEARIELCVSDNGVGLPAGFDLKQDGHLGFRLIHTLAQNSLRAEVEFGSDQGFSCCLKFKAPETDLLP